MKILIVHNEYKQYGGEDTVVNQEHLAYLEMGHEVELFLVSNQELRFFDLIFSPFNLRSYNSIKKKIHQFKPELVHVHNFVFKLSPSIFWAIPKATKTVVTIHNYRFICPSGTLFIDGKIDTSSTSLRGLIKNIGKGIYQKSVLKTMFLAFIYRMNMLLGTFSRVERFIFLTPFSKQIHEQWKKDLFKLGLVKPNFLLGNFDNNTGMREIDIVFIGRFTTEKGILDVIQSLIGQNKLNIHLIGDGPCFDEIKLKTQGHSHITLHGGLPRHKAMKLLEKSKFLIFPSIWYEGMPMTIIEAFSVGVPVIARDIGAMKTMIKDGLTGFFYDNLHALDKIIENIPNVNHKKLANACQSEFWKKYSYAVGKRNLEDLIEKTNEAK